MRAAAATPLGTFLLRKLYAPPMPELECEAFGMKFSSPVGIAAGFDTNGNMIDALSASGFGFVEVGSITPRPQSGSAARRLYRLLVVAALLAAIAVTVLGFFVPGRDDALIGVNTGLYHTVRSWFALL